jgi:hypothetical protein
MEQLELLEQEFKRLFKVTLKGTYFYAAKKYTILQKYGKWGYCKRQPGPYGGNTFSEFKCDSALATFIFMVNRGVIKVGEGNVVDAT